MKPRSDKDLKIPDFSTEEEAFEWYESHGMTDHLKDTEEIKLDNIFYEDSRGHWLRASDGVHVSARKGHAKLGVYAIESQGRIINEVPLRDISIATLENPAEQVDALTFVLEEEGGLLEGGKVTCTQTTFSSATTLKLETK